MADHPLVAEVFGCLGVAGCCLWTFAATRARMIALQLLSGTCFALHWALLGHWTAALSSVLMLALAVVSAVFLLEYLRARAGNAGFGEVGTVTVAERPTRVIVLAPTLAVCGLWPEGVSGHPTGRGSP